MTLKYLSSASLLLFSTLAYSQLTPSDYFSANNPHYWKNRKPHAAYWQQDVSYKIRAKLDEKTDVISATEELTYYNNSPDELTVVYFHLYQNAFTPGSYYEDLNHANKIFPKFGKNEKQGLGTMITKMQTDGQDLKTELDNTILKVYLSKPLKSGESVKFYIEFKSGFQLNTNMRKRMKAFYSYGKLKHYDGVHWYPRISVYDAKQGWDTDQHLEKEFYGDFGTFDVELNLPNDMILEATGTLLNKGDVLPDDLRQKLDIKNFANKPIGSAPSTIIPYDSTQRKTWKYYAQNVHDFAWTCDPTYRLGEVIWNGISIVSIAQEMNAGGWQDAAPFTAKVIQVFSEDFGMYAYPKMVVADARDGMEYPMLTLDGGHSPDYFDLLAHEVGHNWFFGMVGSNETYRAMLDEGFTQFLTNWAYEKIIGNQRVVGVPKSKYLQNFIEPDYVRNTEVYNGYIFDAIQGDETTLNTHSAYFNSAMRHGGGYRQVYMKTATMLYNLQYVLGDDLFLKAMQHYFNKWKMCHPQVEDFRQAIIEYTKTNLNWFFDQWIETSKTIDYSVKCIKKGKEKNQYIITFERTGRMQMPIDFSVMGKNDSVYNFHIPNNDFIKQTNAKVLPKWFGWDKLNPEYEATITIPGGIEDVVIDPSGRMADVNMLNNRKKFPLIYSFDSKVYNPPSWKHYRLYSRPDLWYNGYDGLKAGFHVNGNFANYRHIFDANVWFNTGILQNLQTSIDDSISHINDFDNVSYRFNYKTATDKWSKNSAIWLNAKSLDGLQAYMVGWEKKMLKGNNRFYAFYKSMIRKGSTDLLYLLNTEMWQTNKLNNTVTVGLQHIYNYKYGTGDINLSLRSSTLESDFAYAYINLTVINKNKLGKKLNFNTRTVVQYGSGTSWAPESKLFLAGANTEEQMDNKFTRSQGFFMPEWASYGANTNNFNAGGGLGLRGYSGYLSPEEDEDGNVYFTHTGTSGAALNAELEFDQLFKWGLPKFIYKSKKLYRFVSHVQRTFKINTYLFVDAGIINYYNSKSEMKFGFPRIDAGVGTALTIKRWGVLQMVDPLTIRFDMPLFLNRIPAVDDSHFKFRWVIGISRAF
jgi:aminopeptidase N